MRRVVLSLCFQLLLLFAATKLSVAACGRNASRAPRRPWSRAVQTAVGGHLRPVAERIGARRYTSRHIEEADGHSRKYSACSGHIISWSLPVPLRGKPSGRPIELDEARCREARAAAARSPAIRFAAASFCVADGAPPEFAATSSGNPRGAMAGSRGGLGAVVGGKGSGGASGPGGASGSDVDAGADGSAAIGACAGR